MARRPRLAGRLPDRLRARRRRDRRRPARREGRPAWARRLAGGRTDRHRPAALGAGDPRPRPSCRQPSRPTPRPWRASCRRSRRPSAARCRASSNGPAWSIGRAGCAPTPVVRIAHEQARDRPARPGHPARWRPGQGDRGAGQPLGDDPPAGLPARLHGHPGPRPVRPRAAVHRGRPGPPPVRRGEHPRHGPGARRAARPVPDLDRAPRDDPRLRVRGAPVAPAVPVRAARAPADAVRQGCARSRARGAARPRPIDPRRIGRRALDRADDGPGAARACSARRRRS